MLDFEGIFHAVPTPLLLLSADQPRFTIVDATDAYLAATGTRRDEICGRALFEVFPDNPSDPHASGERNLRASLDRVCVARRADTMPLQRYDIRSRRGVVTDFTERHWAPHNAPAFGRNGELTHVVHRVEDVTARVRAGTRDHAGATVVSSRNDIEVESSRDLVLLRKAVREACVTAAIGEDATVDLLVVASELGGNMTFHANGGSVQVDVIGVDDPLGVRLHFKDRGSGIANLDNALAGGHSTRGTLGRGLAGSRNLVDDFVVDSRSDGTTITVTKWRRSAPRMRLTPR